MSLRCHVIDDYRIGESKNSIERVQSHFETPISATTLGISQRSWTRDKTFKWNADNLQEVSKQSHCMQINVVVVSFVRFIFWNIGQFSKNQIYELLRAAVETTTRQAFCETWNHFGGNQISVDVAPIASNIKFSIFDRNMSFGSDPWMQYADAVLRSQHFIHGYATNGVLRWFVGATTFHCHRCWETERGGNLIKIEFDLDTLRIPFRVSSQRQCWTERG